mgnify:CR=1 FL=1
MLEAMLVVNVATIKHNIARIVIPLQEKKKRRARECEREPG